MFTVETTEEFQTWLDGLRDDRAQFKINQRLLRLQGGNPGDWKTVGDGVSEMRIDYGPGFRIYYTIRERVVYLLLCGSTKRDQDRAIKLAKELAGRI
jgi:putative addiction module killer protein